jgi:TusA-related sulfurtransferase
MVTQRTTSTAQHVPIETDTPEVRLGKAFVMAVVDGDFRRLASLLAADVRFRALVPRAFHEVDSADAARAIFEGWFGETEERELLDSSSELVADRLLVAYRLEFREAGRPLIAEQQLVAIVSDGRLRDVALLCSGFRPVGAISTESSRLGVPPHADAHLDGIGLSCATLTPSIRAAVMAIEPGQVLEITTDDPTAQEGLQSWTRLTGHELLARMPSSDDSDRFYVRRSAEPTATSALGGSSR